MLNCALTLWTGQWSALTRQPVHLSQRVIQNFPEGILSEVWWEKRPWQSKINQEGETPSRTMSSWSRSLTPCYSSVVMTVFMIGIFDSFFFTVMLSVTNHGEISSRLVLAWKLISVFVFLKMKLSFSILFFCQIEFLLGGQSVQINTIDINSPCCCWCSWLFRCCWWGLSCCRWWAAASPRCCSSCCSTSSCCSQSWTWTGWWLQKHGD